MRPGPDTTIYRTPNGDAYHFSQDCDQLPASVDADRITIDTVDDAERSGYDACEACRYDWLPALEDHDRDPTPSDRVEVYR
jgi:hypothetical protein